MAQRADAPFAYASGGRGAFVRTKDAYQLFAGVKPERLREGRGGAARRSGARPGGSASRRAKLDRQRSNLLRLRCSSSSPNATKTNSLALCGRIRQQCALEYADPSDRTGAAACRRSWPRRSALAEVNALSLTSLTATRTASYSLRRLRKPDIQIPTAQEMIARIRPSRRTRRSRRMWTRRPNDALVPNVPAPGKIIAEHTLPETGIIPVGPCRTARRSCSSRRTSRPTRYIFAARSSRRRIARSRCGRDQRGPEFGS